MKRISITQGYTALVSDRDYSRVSRLKWHAWIDRHPDGSVRNVYAYHSYKVEGVQRKVQMHRFILEMIDPEIQVDHRDNNGLNNQRRNLRIATNAQNQRNARKAKGKSSKFKGVTWNKKVKRWQASMTANGKYLYLGLFLSEKEAAFAYTQTAQRIFGRFKNKEAL
jgi:AP2 domain/HNH endonuclease